MKVQIISDLHLEFRDNIPEFSNAGADVLVLAGDICLAEHLYDNPRNAAADANMSRSWHGWDAKRYRDFFQHCSDNWAHVLYVAGNHEHYSGRWDRNSQVLRDEMLNYPNITFGDQARVEIAGVQFLLVSLWTDFNNADPLSMLSARDLMTDYRAISDFSTGYYRKLHTNTVLEKHRNDVHWLKSMLGINKNPTVVVGHHAPSRQSIHEKYADQHHMNGCFASNLEHIMLDNPHIRLWIHGHMHDRFDYQIAETRVICNPLGYPSEYTGFDPALVVEI
jgi:predicted phosphodiesterase